MEMNKETLIGLENRYKMQSQLLFTLSTPTPVILFVIEKYVSHPVFLVMWFLLLILNIIYIALEGWGIGIIGVSIISIFFACLSFVSNSMNLFTIIVFLISGFITLILLTFFIILFKNAYFPRVNYDKIDAFIVLGTKTINGNPGETLKLRLKQLENAIVSNHYAKIIISGGNPSNDIYSEAEVMKNFLEKDGIKNEIILDNDSRNTIENIINATKLLGWDTFKGKACVVTNNYHMFRVKKIAQNLYCKLYPCAASVPFLKILHEWSRELIIYLHDRKKIEGLEEFGILRNFTIDVDENDDFILYEE